MITINDQIDSSKEMLIANGLNADEVLYFERLAKGFTSKSVRLLASHFQALKDLALKKREDDPDATAKVSCTIAINIDFTDIHVLNADYKLRYNNPVVDTDGDREKLGEKQPEEPGAEDLGDLPEPGETPASDEAPAAETPAEPVASEPENKPAE